MPGRRTANERLAELQAKKEKTDARLAALEARLKDRKHKEDIRRQIILGGLVLARAQNEPGIADFIRNIVRHDLKNPAQLMLFADILKGDVA